MPLLIAAVDSAIGMTHNEQYLGELVHVFVSVYLLYGFDLGVVLRARNCRAAYAVQLGSSWKASCLLIFR